MIELAVILSILSAIGTTYLLFFKKDPNSDRLDKLEREVPKVLEGDEDIESMIVHNDKIIYKKLRK